jgi:hypothetical protein
LEDIEGLLAHFYGGYPHHLIEDVPPSLEDVEPFYEDVALGERMWHLFITDGTS